MKTSIISAYEESLEMAKSHYENFPVISLFIPKEKRKDIAVIYRFARSADDIADEGISSAEDKIVKLEEFGKSLQSACDGNHNNPFWEALKLTLDRYNIDPANLFKLLKAFRQDVLKSRYDTHEELLDYCTYSANPVGRIILALFGVKEEQAIKYSDDICTALQLTNFWQDVSVDLNKERIYIPLVDMAGFGVSELSVKERKYSPAFGALMKFQVERTRELFASGKNLLSYLPGRLKLQIAWTISGGEKILDKIEKINFDVLSGRPKLSKLDYLLLMAGSFGKSNR